ncbi:GL13267 [Drosophila persimilis]|uniref:GL13267 n=1 Tax=Drosophila persimilis TaxID=7234 RepID=B4H793_DROPE|nr:GL13267 [Drosophila persimilis]
MPRPRPFTCQLATTDTDMPTIVYQVLHPSGLSVYTIVWTLDDSYPLQAPDWQISRHANLRSGPNKPSSSFDLAIDNKDFDYGNQGRGYKSYAGC